MGSGGHLCAFGVILDRGWDMAMSLIESWCVGVSDGEWELLASLLVSTNYLIPGYWDTGAKCRHHFLHRESDSPVSTLLRIPFEELPLHIHDGDTFDQTVIAWRLRIGR